MSLNNIKAFGCDFDVNVTKRADDKLDIVVSQSGGKTKTYTVKAGQTAKVTL